MLTMSSNSLGLVQHVLCRCYDIYMNIVKIDIAVVNRVIDKLATLPYGEVAQLIGDIHKSVADNNKPSEAQNAE